MICLSVHLEMDHTAVTEGLVELQKAGIEVDGVDMVVLEEVVVVK